MADPSSPLPPDDDDDGNNDNGNDGNNDDENMDADSSTSTSDSASSDSSDDDDDDDDDDDAMEVVPTETADSDDEEEDGDGDRDGDGDLTPPPSAVGGGSATTPKMRIKLSLKMSSRSAAVLASGGGNRSAGKKEGEGEGEGEGEAAKPRAAASDGGGSEDDEAEAMVVVDDAHHDDDDGEVAEAVIASPSPTSAKADASRPMQATHSSAASPAAAYGIGSATSLVGQEEHNPDHIGLARGILKHGSGHWKDMWLDESLNLRHLSRDSLKWRAKHKQVAAMVELLRAGGVGGGGADMGGDMDGEAVAAAIAAAAEQSTTTQSELNALLKSHPHRPPSLSHSSSTNLHLPPTKKVAPPPPSLSRPAGQGPVPHSGGYHTRPVKLPVLVSPGLLVQPSGGANTVGGVGVGETRGYKAVFGGGTSKADAGKDLVEGGKDRDDNLSSSAEGGKGVEGDAKIEEQQKQDIVDSSSRQDKKSDQPTRTNDSSTAAEHPYQNFLTPSSIFEHNMALAGYTTENRTLRPHRGSSVRRTVYDMFDSDVVDTLHFPSLVPEGLFGAKDDGGGIVGDDKKEKASEEEEAKGGAQNGSGKEGDNGGGTRGEEKKEGKKKPDLVNIVRSGIAQFLSKKRRAEEAKGSGNGGDDGSSSNKRRRRCSPLTFADMVPTSLTHPFPPAYVAARVEHAKLVKAREDAIASSQDAIDAAHDATEAYELEKVRWNQRVAVWERIRAERKAAKASAETAADGDGDGGAKSETKDGGGEDDNDDDDDDDDGTPPPMPVPPPIPAPVHVPPIPVPPSPPGMEEEGGGDGEGGSRKEGVVAERAEQSEKGGQKCPSSDNGGRSSVLRRAPPPNPDLLTHLDPSSYLDPTSRYFGLLTNSIADPNFIGPNAPGIVGINVAGGTGLATAYVGYPQGGSAAMHSSSYYAGLDGILGTNNNANAVVGSADSAAGGVGGGGGGSSLKRSSGGGGGGGSLKKSVGLGVASEGDGDDAEDGGGRASGGARSPSSVAAASSASSSLNASLKRLMDTGGPDADAMRVTIVRAAVHAARSGIQGSRGMFVGAHDGRTYGDVGRAFSNYGNIKPCARCRNNKQGAYHCRLRRRHGDADWDGGSSAEVLKALFKEPLKNLEAGAVPAEKAVATSADGG